MALIGRRTSDTYAMVCTTAYAISAHIAPCGHNSVITASAVGLERVAADPGGSVAGSSLMALIHSATNNIGAEINFGCRSRGLIIRPNRIANVSWKL